MGENVKHTPGPWITFQPRGDGSVPVRTDGLGLTICYVHDGVICNAIANARLIAAAPDLLAVLKRIASAMDFNGTCHPLFDGMQKQMMDAIAKAEGRQ